MSGIASKKKRNEFLISSIEKSKGYSTVFLSFYSIPIYSRQSVFFSLSFLLIWLVQAKILRDVPKTQKPNHLFSGTKVSQALTPWLSMEWYNALLSGAYKFRFW